MREWVFLARRPCGHIVGCAVDDDSGVSRSFVAEMVIGAFRRGDNVSRELITSPVKIGGDCPHGETCERNLWIDAGGRLWRGPLTVEGSNFHYAVLSGFEGAEGGGVKQSWILARSDADPTWLPFVWPEEPPHA